MGMIMDVGTVSEQATRISRASRAVDSSFAMSVDSPFWSVSGSAFYYTSTCPQPLSPELEERFPLSCLAFRGPFHRGLPTVSSNSHRFGALSMLQKAFDLTRTVLESTKDFGLRRGSNGDWAIVVSLMLGRTSESLDAVKLLLCRHLLGRINFVPRYSTIVDDPPTLDQLAKAWTIWRRWITSFAVVGVACVFQMWALLQRRPAAPVW